MRRTERMERAGKRLKLVNPFMDWTFKKLFASEANKESLIYFLNAVLEGEKQIRELFYLNTEVIPVRRDGRYCVFDILARDEKGDTYIVEMQNASQEYFKERAIYYSFRLYVENGQQGKHFKYRVKGVYTICILNFKIESNTKLRTDYGLCDLQEQKDVLKNFRIILLQIPRFDKKLEECITRYDKWLYLLKNMEYMEKLPIDYRIEEYRKFLERANVEAMTPGEKAQYEVDLQAYWDLVNCVDYAKKTGYREGRKEGLEAGRAEGLKKGIAEGIEQGIEQGMEKGIEKGLEQGLERGIEQGIEKGIRQGMEKGVKEGLSEGEKEGKRIKQLEIARKMKEKHLDIALILECTGLAEEDFFSL